MKRLVYLITIILGCITLTHSQAVIHLNMSHTRVKADVPFPLLSDSRLNEMKNEYNQELLKYKANTIMFESIKKMGSFYNLLYPKLILNNVVISDTALLNCFRNRIELVNLKSAKRILKAQAEKMGIPNVPKDGVLFVTTKKGYYFDFSCE